MYAESVILDKLARFESKYGWMPVEHSVEEVEQFNNWLKTQYQTDSTGRQYFDDSQWTPSIVRWIQNERAMCAINFEYYLTRYHFIAAENSIFRFRWRGGQRVLYRVIQKLEAAGKAIEILLLKARQGGFSTFVEALLTHRALFVPGVKCAVGSANDQKTYVMMGMMYTALEHLPWWLPPKQTKDKRSGAALLEFAHVGSQIVIQSGSMKGGIGQGTTPTAIHLSEVCDYTNPVAQIEEGLFRAVHKGPEILMVLESTGNGNTGWWADQWRNAKEFYFQGKSRLYPLFIPWFMTPELYPKPAWLHDCPIPQGWVPNDDTRTVIAKCEAYANNTPALSEVLGKGWKMPLAQQWFWEFNYDDAKRRRTDKSWLRHMPCDDYDALIGDNDSVFDWETINVIEKRRSRIISVYGILGEGIAEKHDPPPINVDSGGTRLATSWTTSHGFKLEWFFMPLLGDPENASFDPLKKFIVYTHPERGAQYSIGIDPGTGVGGDRTIITVNKSGQDAVPDIQVAEFSSDDIDNVEIFAWACAIASYYAKFMLEEDDQPKIIIEQRRKYGDSCYHAMKLHGFRKHHHFRAYDKKTMKAKPTEASREGWFTNEWSRPLLLGAFKNAVSNGWYVVNSRWLAAEIESFEQSSTTSGKSRWDHIEGKHDDRIFASAMAYFTMHDMDVLAERSQLKYMAPEEDDWIINYEPFQYSIPNPKVKEFLAEYAIR